MKKIFIWIGLSILMMILWIMGLIIGNEIFPSSLMEMQPDSGSNAELMLFLACVLNTGVILLLIYNSRYKGWRLAGAVFLVSFGIQYFMSQIETLWFNDSLNLPVNGIWAIISGGVIMSFLFSLIATWFTGNFSRSKVSTKGNVIGNPGSMVKKIVLLSVLIWPLIYFLFGYLVAWQFAEVRLLYSGTTEMDSFLSIMKANFASGLYFFQIIRGGLWILIGLLVLAMTKGSIIRKGVILGLLFTILGSSGLLLPNPIMSDTVRMAHIIETSTSDFLWGFIIAWYLGQHVSNESNENLGFLLIE